MAREIVVQLGDAVGTFTFKKVDRAQIYGRRVRRVLDPDGQPCRRAELTGDGAVVLQPGMTAQGYFDEDGHQVPHGELVGIHPDGTIAEVHPSTLGEAQTLEGPVDPAELFDLSIQSIYLLRPQELDAALRDALDRGDLYRFPFSWRTDYRSQTAFLLSNDHGYFAVIGQMTSPVWCELRQPALELDDDDASDGDLDFEML